MVNCSVSDSEHVFCARALRLAGKESPSVQQVTPVTGCSDSGELTLNMASDTQRASAFQVECAP